MGRRFNLLQGSRYLQVCVVPVDEAWELWLCENDRRLMLGATVAIDMATEGWRQGRDVIAQTVDRIRGDVARGVIVVPDLLAGSSAQSSASTSAKPLRSS